MRGAILPRADQHCCGPQRPAAARVRGRSSCRRTSRRRLCSVGSIASWPCWASCLLVCIGLYAALVIPARRAQATVAAARIVRDVGANVRRVARRMRVSPNVPDRLRDDVGLQKLSGRGDRPARPAAAVQGACPSCASTRPARASRATRSTTAT